MSQPGFYPPRPDFPAPELLYLANAIPSGNLNRQDAIQAGLTICQYANAQIKTLGEPTAAKASKAPKLKKLTEKKLVAALKDAAEKKDGAAAGVIPWAQIIGTLLPLIAKWIEQQLGG